MHEPSACLVLFSVWKCLGNPCLIPEDSFSYLRSSLLARIGPLENAEQVHFCAIDGNVNGAIGTCQRWQDCLVPETMYFTSLSPCVLQVEFPAVY